jgi:hypothetical protein
LGGQVLIPPSHSSQFVVGAAAKQGGEHQPKDLGSCVITVRAVISWPHERLSAWRPLG